MTNDELELMKRTLNELCGVVLRLQVDMAGKADLRDQFAMETLNGLVNRYGTLSRDGIAEEAYLLADALMEKRK